MEGKKMQKNMLWIAYKGEKRYIHRCLSVLILSLKELVSYFPLEKSTR